MPRPALWTVGWLSGATCLSVAFLDGPAGGPRLEPGRAGQLLNALGLWKEAVWERRLGPEVHGEPFGLFGLGWEISFGKHDGFGEQLLEPQGGDLGGGGACLPWHGVKIFLLPPRISNRATTDHTDPLAPVRFRGRTRGPKLAW